MKPVVYIASPYSKGDQSRNAEFQFKVMHQMLDDGLVIPFPPLFSHYAHVYRNRPYQDWVDYDNAMIDRGMFDCCLRLNVDDGDYHVSKSPGADAEVELFTRIGLPVFYSIRELYTTINTIRQNQCPHTTK